MQVLNAHWQSSIQAGNHTLLSKQHDNSNSGHSWCIVVVQNRDKVVYVSIPSEERHESIGLLSSYESIVGLCSLTGLGEGKFSSSQLYSALNLIMGRILGEGLEQIHTCLVCKCQMHSNDQIYKPKTIQ